MLKHYSQQHINCLLLTPGQEGDPGKQAVGVMDLNTDKSSMEKKNQPHQHHKHSYPCESQARSFLCCAFSSGNLTSTSRSLAVISHGSFRTVQRGTFLNVAQRAEDVHQVRHATRVHAFPQSLPRWDWETACFDTEQGKSSDKPRLCRDPAAGWTDVPCGWGTSINDRYRTLEDQIFNFLPLAFCLWEQVDL